MSFLLKNVSVSENCKIVDAIKAINLGHIGLVVVVDSFGKLKGLVADGDVRRGIIEGVSLEAPVSKIMRNDPLFLVEPVVDESVLNLMQTSRFIETTPAFIPIVDKNMHLKSIRHVSELGCSLTDDKLTNKSRYRNIVLIGGGGYIGSVLTRLLIDEGFFVTILDSFLYGDASIAEIRQHERCKIMRGDTRHIDTLVSAFKDADAVIHLAELVGDPLCGLDPQQTFEINYLATSTISNICAELQINKFIYLSSCSVYGVSDDAEALLTEESSFSPVSLYAKMKINAERAIMRVDSSSFSPSILRLGTVFGHSFRPRFDLVVNLLTAKAYFDGVITIFGGQQWRPHVHVKDVAMAIKSVLLSPNELVSRQVFNIVGESLKIIDIGMLIKQVLPNAELSINENNQDIRDYRVSGKKAKEMLGFVPSMRVLDGINEIVAALEGGRIVDYKKKEYKNYDCFV